MIKACFENVKKSRPLVHNITNYVTVNDCANVLLACGASPIMADEIDEVEEITTICGALNINIGTLNKRTIEAMVKAGKKANELNHPVTLDPVGISASTIRINTVKRLLGEVKFTVIRGNISEIKSLAIGEGKTNGVDASDIDAINDDNVSDAIKFARELSKNTGAIIVITGKIDIVTDAKTSYICKNGHAMMSDISGTGCMLNAMLAAYICANKGNELAACLSCVTLLGVAGERADKSKGNTSYRDSIMDEIYTMTVENLENGAKYELFK